VPVPVSEDLAIGARIAAHRRRLGLTQQGLAMRLHRSTSWVTKIERGDRPLDSVRTLLEVARALGVEVRELTGQPWFPEPGGPGHEHVPALRRALTSLWPRTVHDDDHTVEVRELGTLRRDVLDAGRLWQAEPNCYSAVIPLLPDLVTEARLTAAAAAGDEQRSAGRVLATVCQLAQEVAARLGEPDLSWIAAHRSLLAARDADDPLLAAASAWRVCHAVLRVDHLDEVHDVVTGAAADLRPRLRDPTPEALSVYGALHLVGAVAAARGNDPATAFGFLDQARATADRLGADRNDFWLTFGPTNVAIHDVAVRLELGDPAGALRQAVAVDPSGLPSLERRSTHHVQLAHAYSLRRRYDEAVGALLAAERLNPEGLRYNMLVRELVRSLLRRDRRRTTPGLRGLARRLNLLDG
jgi:transcriptional regulator with XRE-family HTH domain